MALHDMAKMTVTGTPGTGTITLNAAVSGFQTFAAAGVTNSEVVSYSISDGTSWEVGRGTYTTSGTTLTRGAIYSSNSNSAISATSAAIVAIVALAEDIIPWNSVTGAGVLTSPANPSNSLLTLIGATALTTSQPVLNMTQTWNAGAVAFTGISYAITDTASAQASYMLRSTASSMTNTNKELFSLLKTSANRWYARLNSNIGFAGYSDESTPKAKINLFTVTGGGGLQLASDIPIQFHSGTNLDSGSLDTFITRAAAATVQHGAADAAAPIAQTLQAQSVIAGTSNTSGVDFTIQGSRGTGDHLGGDLVFKLAPAGGSGTGQNAAAEVARLLAVGNVKFTNAANFSANGSVATVLGSIGPTGAQTTVQTWLTIVDSTGATRYIPCF